MGIFYKNRIGRLNVRVLCAVLFTVLFLAADMGSACAQNANASQTSQNKKKRITGTLTDTDGTPLIGASVQIQNTSIGTVTNASGLYVIDAKEGESLVFSYIGYISQTVKVGAQSVINASLKADEQMFEEVVVVGYGTQKKGSVVSSVSTIGTRDLRTPSSNLTSTLAGQLSGLISIQRSSEPGRDDAEFWIRGIATNQGGSKPLVLVDGMPREISNIEPDEIESFSLLKDAAATAVYGAEGANGVILVTTKRGTISKPKISFRAEYSIASPQRVPEFVDSWDYLDLANEASFNDGMTPYKTAAEIDMYRAQTDNDLYPNSNWMNELLRSNVQNQRYTLNFRGGAENAKYFVSMAYLNQGGVFKDNPMGKYDSDFGFQRYNLRSNIDLKVSKTTKLAVDLAGQYINRLTPNRSADDIFSFMLNTPPHLFPAIYSDGTLSTYAKESDANNRNPFNMLYNQGYRKEFATKIQGGVTVDQDLSFITKGLSINGKVGLDYDNNLSTLRDYGPSRFNAIGRDADGNLIFQTSVLGSEEMGEPVFTTDAKKAYRKIYIQGSVNYNRVFKKHTVGAMGLYMQKEDQKHSVVLPYRKQGIVGRVTYSYDNRYFIEGNFGYTGSENFAKGYRFGFFPAVGVSYYISNERFYPEKLKNFMNSAKIRLSYGRTGNDEVVNNDTNRFMYQPTFNLGGYNFMQGIGTGASNGLGTGVQDLRFYNPDIRWEIEYKRNIGLDLAFARNRFELTVDYFNNQRQDILVRRSTVPGITGFHEAPWKNMGIVKNHGVDASMSARHNFGDVFVSARGTFTFARNKVIEQDELPQDYDYQRFTGGRVGERKVYVAERLYTEDDFIRMQKNNGTYTYELKPGLPSVALGGLLGPGDIKYVDLNNDGKIDPDDKTTGMGYAYNPEINYGFGLNVEYKGFYVSAFFQGVANTSILLAEGNNTFWPFNWGIEKSNYRKDFLDRWTAEDPRQDVLMPRLHVGYANSVNKEESTWWLKNGNFLRFKNLEFGYNVPKSFTKKIRMDAVRVYVMGTNLCVWDDFKLWDPEMGNRNKGNNYPMSRTFTFGLELTF